MKAWRKLMSKKKIKNTRQQPKKNNKLNYKLEFEKLRKENIQLKNENTLLKAFNQPTATQKIEIIEEYYHWLADEEIDANQAITLFTYKKKLKKQARQYE